MALRKKIGFYVGHPEEQYQSDFIKGFLEQATAEKYDVAVFAMYEKYQSSEQREKGAACIFNLVNPEMFDAFVVLADTIQTPGVIEQIEEHLHGYGNKPVLFVDKESQYFPSIMMDHYTPTKQVISHLIEKHGYTDIAYLTGKRYHPHSIQRLNAFLDCMKEHGLEVPEDHIFYGDFWYSSGISVAQQLICDGGKLPQAIACVNDCMAIGLAGTLEKEGIRVPEDIAVVGYDALMVGRTSPKPLTSAPIPSYQCGRHAVACVDRLLAGDEILPFSSEVQLFVGASCGCHYEPVLYPEKLRDSWEVSHFVDDFDSVANHLADDLLLQSNLLGVVSTVFYYCNQIKPYKEFHLCLNTDWMEPPAEIPQFTDEMIHALRCATDNRELDKVDTNARFDKNELIPGIFTQEERPHAYMITPLSFEEKCFGFAAVSYGDCFGSYDATYRMWIGNVARGFESFRRFSAYEKANALLKAEKVRDSLTGFYNYDGLLENAAAALSQFGGAKGYADIIAVDILGLTNMNNHYGIQGGNQVIVDTAKMLEQAAGNGICCCLGNGEFLVANIWESQAERILPAFETHMTEYLQQYNKEIGMEELLSIAVGEASGEIDSPGAIEQLVNTAVSNKNGNKVKEQKQKQNSAVLTEEEKKEAEVVKDILDHNKLFYNFQPIVDAATGEIYAYEALMRADVQPFVSPLQILKYAEHFERLYDVEKATFFNVLNYIEQNHQLFEGKKVFINSIPGNRLRGDDAEIIANKLRAQDGGVVVELTEQAELDDDELKQLKQDFLNMGIDIAVDDYGTGYSNVTNLLRYMPNVVKIDRMLLTGIQNSPQKQHFVREIVTFSHDNNIKVLAEGIETTEEMKTVIEIGVDFIQGYYTGKPSREVVASIDMSIRNEIIQYNQARSGGRRGKIHMAGQENKISIVKLAAEHHTSIHCDPEQMNHRDITISGVPGFESCMDLVIADGYVGTIEIEDSSFSGKKGSPAIAIGDNCDVTLVLIGENVITEGGILVPESSSLRIIGDGNLYIEKIAIEGFGIGNDKEHKHGTLIFDQYGSIEIAGNSMYGVGIGSGLGGEIFIRAGLYRLKLSGQYAVGIGTLCAPAILEIRTCSIEMNISVAVNVGIGSLEDNADIAIYNASVTGRFGGTESVGIGSLRGLETKIYTSEVLIELNMRCEQASGVGCLENAAEIIFKLSTISIISKSKKAVALGSVEEKGTFTAQDVDITTDIRTSLSTDIGAQEIRLINGRYSFKVNGENLERTFIEEY